MDFLTAVQVLGHRWKTFALGLVVTVVATVAAMVTVAPSYTATAGYVLLVQRQTGHDGEQLVRLNPYANFPQGLPATSEILIEWFNGQEAQQAIAAAGGAGTVSASGLDGDAPLVEVQVRGADPDTTMLTTDLAAQALRSQLLTLQTEAGVAPRAQITLEDASVPTQAGTDRVSQIRAGAALFLAGLLVTLFVVFLKERRSWPAGGTTR